MKRGIKILILVNICTALLAFYLAMSTRFPDHQIYDSLASGLAVGRFSQWYFLDFYVPDALRSFGYPVFLLICKTIIDSDLFVRIIQLLMYFLSLFLAYKILVKLSNNNDVAKIIFLGFTAINIQIPYYSGGIVAEMPCIFLSVLFMFILINRELTFKYAIILGLIGGILFQMRPAFLLFPFLLIGYSLIFNFKKFNFFIIQAFVFSLTLLPYGFWNLNNHGVFKVTPLEGAAEISYLSYWYYKLPIDYANYGNDLRIDEILFELKMVGDFTNPFDYTNEEREKNKQIYENECLGIIEELKPILNEEDLKKIETMRVGENRRKGGGYIQYPSKYFLAKQKILWALLIDKIKENPVYYFSTRIYGIGRIYFSGINITMYNYNTSLSSKLKLIVPFLITFSCIFLGLIGSIFYFLVKRRKLSDSFILLLFFSLYQGSVHVLFLTHSRYTINIHFFVLIMISLIISRIVTKKSYVKLTP